MKHLVKTICFLCVAIGVTLTASAQPAKSRVAKTPTAPTKAVTAPTSKATITDRATLMFPAATEMPEDVVWRRDIYRILDLTKDANAPLYYPVVPSGKNQNLFTYIFRLWLSDRLPVYEYKLDGNESFEKKDCLKGDSAKEAFLSRYSIYYEKQGNKIVVPESDIPSAQVKRYYVKESSYFDQQSATYKTRVTALCPVLIEEDVFVLDEDKDSSVGGTPKPLFWVNYDDLATYLSRMPLMASNLNNVTNMTTADYFTMNKYEGKIYKTNNMQGKLLQDYCKTDSALTKEQDRIEQELSDFEAGIWGKVEHPDTTAAVADSLVAEDTLAPKASAKRTASASKTKSTKSEDNTSRRSKAAAKVKTSAPKSAPRVSARRQRR